MNKILGRSLLLLGALVLLTACSKEQSKKVSNQTKMDADVPQNVINDPLVEQPEEKTDTTVVDSESNESGNTEKASVSDQVLKNIKETINEFEGYVGQAKVHMSFECSEDDRVSGSYYYEKYKTEIAIDGYVDCSFAQNVYFSCIEDTESEGEFCGIFRTNDYIQGYWKSEDSLYPMYLIRVGAKVTTPPQLSDNDIPYIDAEWYGLNDTYFSKSQITAKLLFPDLLYYDMTAYNGAASGSLSSLAMKVGDVFQTEFSDTIENDNKLENVKMVFHIENDLLKLSSNDYSYACGMGVTFDDTYSKRSSYTLTPTPMEVGIVDTKKKENLFINMTDYNNLFIQYTQFVNYEEVLLDGKAVKAGSSYLRGCSGNCFYIDAEEYLYAAVYDYETIDYYTNDSNYATEMPEPMKEWANGFNVDIVYHEITAPHPFDEAIPSLLSEQVEKLKMEQELNLPEGYSLLDYCFGDLNQDGEDELAVVIEQGQGEWTGSRVVYIFINESGRYKLLAKNSDTILGGSEGGVFGDPYDDTEIKDGELILSNYGGSSYRWSYKYCFRMKKNQLMLTNIRIIDYSTMTLNGIETIIDYENKKYETKSVVFDTDTYSEELNGLLLFQSDILGETEITFEEVYSDISYEVMNNQSEEMPKLYLYDYGCIDGKNSNMTPTEVLDLVAQRYESDMKKVEYSCGMEILHNYRLLLGYDIPTYYYSDGESNLWYSEMFYDENNKEYRHQIIKSTDNKNNYSARVYYDCDDFGEIKVW